MADHSKIEWTEATWNPTVGCDIVSAGCKKCYAMRDAYRKGFNPKIPRYHGLTRMTKAGPVWTGEVRTVPELLDAPLHWKTPRRIFVDSMSDLFYGDEADRLRCEQRGTPFQPVPFEFIADVFAVMACTTRHVYQILTKRPQRMRDFFAWLELDGFGFPAQVDPLKVWPQWTPCRGGRGGYDNCGPAWPLANVWLGVSVEDQARADERIPLLLQTPAAVRWISAEPLLGPVDIGRWLELGRWDGVGRPLPLKTLNWVVVGGESGPGARPFDIAWARSLRDQCRAAGVRYFMKQLGADIVGDANDIRNPRLEGDTPMIGDGRGGALARFRFKDRKGGDPAEWPEDLRVREYPA